MLQNAWTSTSSCVRALARMIDTSVLNSGSSGCMRMRNWDGMGYLS
jgi:hypothetical protein